MRVKDIQIDGFGVWTGLSVDSLPEGMTLLYGPNEAGKTTLMQFMRAMLYGFTDDRRKKYLPPVHGGSPGGAIRVTGPGGGYQIRRHSQLTDTDIAGRLTVTGQDGLSQGGHRLSMLLGQIDEPIFTNVFAIGLRELQELSTLDDTSAADELYKLSSGLDRVSLVDVLRSLRGGRKDLIGEADLEDDAEASKLTNLITKREKLRDEVQQLTRGGRRWSELALQRRAQHQEIEQLTQRMSAWEHESRCVEIASGVFEVWAQREQVAELIEQTESESQLPDDAPAQLVQVDAMIDDRREKLEQVRNKRRAIRDKAEQLPVSRRMFDLTGRIEAASEQATWIEALEEQIGRLEVQIDKARKRLDSDAERLGMDESDRRELVDGDASKLPDLSRQTLSALSDPAKRVKEQSFLLKQARAESADHKARAEKLGEQLKETLQHARATNLQQAIRQEHKTLATLRQYLQLDEHLDKLKRHYRDLEKETVELTTSEALPIDRVVLLGLPFIVGGMALVYGICSILELTWFDSDPDPTLGMLWIFIGCMSLLAYYFGRENGQRSTSLERQDCDRQIDTLRRQIREVEAERNDVDSSLPVNSQSLEVRVRDSERLLSELESSLPTYHSHQAALESYKAARDRASSALKAGREARLSWSETLDRLGLSSSLSPSSVRKLSSGYETLQESRRRLNELVVEKQQRRRERQTIAKRIEALYLEALEVNEHASTDRPRDEGAHADEGARADDDAPTPQFKPRTGPLEQLNHLHEELSRQQHWIKRRRELKEQDHQLKRQQGSYHRAIERGEQQRRALWAKCGVATPDQFYELVDSKASLVELRERFDDLDNKVRSIIGTHIDYDDVATEIGDSSATDLEKRWESLTTRTTETEDRIARLRTRQGELGQEMKHLGDDNRLTTAQLELGCVTRQIETVSRRWQTLAMASGLLEDVCGTFERERQPETLREASSFLNQLTDGKYTRIWTPLGTNQLKIDDRDEKSLPLEVLSRGTREAVFIALRLSLAAAYARRGVMLPLVLDDVLVNFDRDRAVHAARTLKTFAELGHQVMMFTCHDHIVEIFHDIDVEVRLLPPQGEPGRACVLPAEHEEELDEEFEEEEEAEDEVIEEPVMEEEPLMEEEPQIEEEPEIELVEPDPTPAPEPKIVAAEKPREKTKLKKRVKADPPRPLDVKPTQRVAEAVDPDPAIGWAWFQQEPSARLDEMEDALASISEDHWIDDVPPQSSHSVPDEVWNRNASWWNGNRPPQ